MTKLLIDLKNRRLSGAHTEGVTPVPIPNTVVKPFEADGTWATQLWESR